VHVSKCLHQHKVWREEKDPRLYELGGARSRNKEGSRTGQNPEKKPKKNGVNLLSKDRWAKARRG